ncbi:uroporphyrinogen decarboxylase family protein [Dehalobacterium formicoaceticum]|uniref:Uroporphyrinogen decarboxylase (URO-D) domain-containing protein n=1 Tax=Dehalobacterium formicoaceticum TaxID=51515 RepID=A0ABT1Y184_9FIRM|nr:uroporphyrinogen decarboxylase family protein [Dehalobacterium formicoaceticum]MCR6544622.1 hypothetical protein [Dehalobacterium formicoaceticum]
MKEMTPTERMIATLEHKPVDRVPVMILLGTTWTINRAGISYDDYYGMEDLGVEMTVKAFDDIKSETVSVGNWTGWLKAFGCPTITSQPCKDVTVEEAFTDVKTEIPKLDKSKIRQQLEECELIQKILQQAAGVKKAVGDRKFLSAAITGPFTAAGLLVGIKDLMKLVGKKNPLADELLDYMSTACAEYANMLIENGVDIIFICDPSSSGDMIGPKQFDAYSVPAMKQFNDQLRNCKYFFLHMCGKTDMRIPEVKKLGFVDAYSIDSPVDLKYALEVAGDELTIMGNMNTVDDMLFGTPERCYDEAYKRIELAGLNGGYILMPGCDIPAKTTIENLLAMTRASEDYAAKHK